MHASVDEHSTGFFDFAQAVDVPLGHVPKAAVERLVRFYRGQDAHLLSGVALRLIRALFADLPLSHKAAPPKAKVLLHACSPQLAWRGVSCSMPSCMHSHQIPERWELQGRR